MFKKAESQPLSSLLSLPPRQLILRNNGHPEFKKDGVVGVDMLGLNGVVFEWNITVFMFYLLGTAEMVVNLGRDVDYDKAGPDRDFEMEGFKVLFFPF